MNSLAEQEFHLGGEQDSSIPSKETRKKNTQPLGPISEVSQYPSDLDTQSRCLTEITTSQEEMGQ